MDVETIYNKITGSTTIWTVIGVSLTILVPLIATIWTRVEANSEQINTTRVDVAVLQSQYENIDESLKDIKNILEKRK